MSDTVPTHAPANVEKGIAPLCAALNSVPGVATLWSCEGHPTRHMRPYVVFAGPQPFAFALHRALCHPSPHAAALRFNWKLIANFRDNGTLQWILDPDDERIAAPGLFGIPRWTRRQADADIAVLTTIVHALAKANGCSAGDRAE